VSEQPSFPEASIFVLRFWRESLGAGSRWRGRIEHVQSGESAAFGDVSGMLAFLRRFGIAAGEHSGGAGRVLSQDNRDSGAK
jgi:hypothetical protein